MNRDIRERHAQRVALVKARALIRKQAGLKGHLKHTRTCACGMAIRGNVYFRHIRSCSAQRP